jgi:hypothetical protein
MQQANHPKYGTICMGSYHIKKQDMISCPKWKWKILVASGTENRISLTAL